jgi:hypothetical protein
MNEMIQESGAKATGMVHVTQTNELGQIVNEFDVPNLVVTTGKNYIAGKMIATTSNNPVAMTHMAIGTGTASPVVGDTALGTQTARVLLSGAVQGTNDITYTATFPAGTGTGAITEAGIFNASVNGTLLCRTTFPTVTKQAGDTIAITWKVTVS